MPFLYETHMHTCQGSACGRATGREQARVYRDAGYTGIIITDHFFGGNTAVDRRLPWAAQPLEAEEITAFLDRSRKLLAMLVK